MSARPGPQLKFVGPGTLEVTVTYLEMMARPSLPPPPAPPVAYRIDRVERPSVPFYRYLYNTVGEPWLWHERRKAGDDELTEILGDTNLWLYVMYAGGEPAGYAELDARRLPEVELAYFGIIPKFIGQRLGQIGRAHV